METDSILTSYLASILYLFPATFAMCPSLVFVASSPLYSASGFVQLASLPDCQGPFQESLIAFMSLMCTISLFHYWSPGLCSGPGPDVSLRSQPVTAQRGVRLLAATQLCFGLKSFLSVRALPCTVHHGGCLCDELDPLAFLPSSPRRSQSCTG